MAAQYSNPTQVPNQTITSGTWHFADTNALAASNVVISGRASVTFVAGNCIHLQPGFHATAGTAGTTFHAWVETAPTAVSFSPSNNSGLTQQFTLTGSSPVGYGNLSEIYGLFNTSVSGQNACYIRYHRAANLLYLADNAGSTWLGGFLPGSAGSASNSQCSIQGNGSSFSTGGTQLSVTVAVTFQTAFAGAKNEYLNVYNNEGLYSTWQQMDTWMVPGPDFTLSTPQDTYSIITGVLATPAYTLTVTPINGFSSPISFSVTPFYGCWSAFFSPPSVAGPPWTTTLTMSCYEQYPNTYVTTVQAIGGGITRTLPLYLRVTATPQYYLTTTVTPPGAGSITLNPPGGWYNSGTQVQVLAAPAAGYTFTGFTGNLTGTALPQTLVMNANKSVTANFTVTPPGQYSLTTSVNAAGAGTISPGSGPYNSGSPVTITATPASGYQFTGFTGDLSGMANPQRLTMNGPKSVAAYFVPSGAQSFSFPYTDANGITRTWTITTQALAHVFTWDSSHWTYEPSVVLPSPQTNGQYVLIFSSGTTFGQQGIYVATADSRQAASGYPENPQCYPDVILSGSLDAATAGNPGFGFESEECGRGRPDLGLPADQPCPSSGVGFYPYPVPYADPNYLDYNGGFYFPGPLSGTNPTIMFRPRVARNLYGYIDPVPGSSPRRWETYLYYSDCDWVTQGKGCGFGVSLLTITQQ